MKYYRLNRPTLPIKHPMQQPMLLLWVLVFMLLSGTTVQAQVEKRLYLKDGQELNRVQPTSGTAQNTAPLIFAQPTYTTTPSATMTSATTPTTLTSAAINPAGTGRILIVAVASQSNGSNVTGVTFSNGSQAFTRLGTAETNGTNTAELWYLVAPNTGSGTVSVNFSPAPARALMGVGVFNNVNQTSPFVNFVQGQAASVTSFQQSIATNTGDLVIHAASNSGGAANSAITNLQTLITSGVVSTGGDRTRAGLQYTTAGGASTTMEWTAPQAGPFAGIIAVLNRDVNTVSFPQAPNFCSGFTIKTGQTITVQAHAAVASGTLNTTPLPATARLMHGATQVAQFTSAVNSGLSTTATGTLTWTGTIGADYTVPAGQNLTLEFINGQATPFTIHYDATNRVSYLGLPTETYVNIESLDVYNDSFSDGSIITENAVGFPNYVRVVVSDPFGFTDITGLNVNITGAATASGAATSVATAGCTRTYEFEWIPTVAGSYNIEVTALEGTEGTVTHVDDIDFDVIGPSITVEKELTTPASGPYLVDDELTYTITVTNTGPVTLTTVPLQDIFSSGCFEFVNASVAPTNTAPGFLSWTNIGPIAPSEDEDITVTLRVTGNCDNASNRARVQNARYAVDAITYSAPTQEDEVIISIDTPPVANDDDFCIQGATPLNVLANDTDDDVAGFLSDHESDYTVTIVSPPGVGSASVNGDNTVQFTPTGMSENQTTTFVYRVTEDANPTLFSEATVTVLFSAVNDPPIAVDDNVVSTSELPIVIDVLANDSDPDGEMTVTDIISGPSNGTAQINPDNTITYTPFPGFEGTDTFVYEVTDDGCPLPAESSTATVTIDVIFSWYACAGGESVISVAPIPGATGYIWDLPAGASITDGDGTNEITVDWGTVEPGQYTICVEPENDCGPGTEQCVELVISELDLTLTPNDVLCNGADDGSITLEVSGGIPPFTYAWTKTGDGTFSSNVQNPGGLEPGEYTVVVTDKNGCSASDTVEITQPDTALQVSGIVTDADPYPSANGAIDLTVEDGTPGYSFLWTKVGDEDFIAISEDLDNLEGGVYKVVVTDENGCEVIEYFTVNWIGAPLEIIGVPTDVLCFGDATGEINLSVIGGIPTYTYSWTASNGGSVPGGQETNQDLTGLVPGTYSVTVTDSADPAQQESIDVDVIGPAEDLVAVAAETDISCNGSGDGSIELTVSGGTAPYTYVWSNGAVTQNLSGLGPGTYSVVVTDANGCQTGDSVTINEPDVIQLSGVVTNSSCDGTGDSGAIDITVSGGSGGYTFLWSTGATTEDVTDLSPGSYSVVVTDSNGCTRAQSFTVRNVCIDVEKIVLSGPTTNNDGTYTLTYQISVKNIGNTNLFDVQVEDDLSAVYDTFNIDEVTSATFDLNGSFDGDTTIELLDAAQTLVPNQEKRINITLTVTPGEFDNPYVNEVTATAEDVDGVITSDDDDAEVNFVEDAIIGVSKQVTEGPENNGDGSYELTFTIRVRNFGDVPLEDVQVTEDLDAAFGAGDYQVNLVTAGTGFTANMSFDGSTDKNLLSASTTMDVGELRVITLQLTVTPDNPGPFENQIEATGVGLGGTPTSDLSTDTVTPIPGDDDPTVIVFPENPEIGLAKRVVGSPINNNDGTYTFTYEFRVKNTGDITLVDVQIEDDLTATFPGKTVVVDDISSATLTPNMSFDGDTDQNILDGTDQLLSGETKLVTVVLTVTPEDFLGPYNNTATATAESLFGVPVDDISHNGSDVDPENDGPGNNSDPTPVSFSEAPLIGLAKTVTDVVNNEDGTYDVTYTIYVRNYGNVPLVDVQVTDDLSTTFNQAVDFEVLDVSASGSLTANELYDGDTEQFLLVSGSSSVAHNTVETITLEVRVTPGDFLGVYNNSAIGDATGPGETPTSDVSQNGTNPDPDNDGNPNNNSQPTPLTFTEDPFLTVSKEISGAISNNGDDYTFVYEIRVDNTGDVPITSLQIIDNLGEAFENATSFSVNSTTITQQPVSTTITLNGSYDGSTDTELLDGNGTLEVDEFVIVQINLTVTAIPMVNPGGPYTNDVAALAFSAGGRFIINFDFDVVTLFENPEIQVTKTFISAEDNGDETQRITFRIDIENTGDVNPIELELFDDIVDQFSGLNPQNFSAEEGLSLATNPDWDGTASSNILEPGQFFDPEIEDEYYVFIVFDVTPGLTPSTDNTVFANAEGPLGTPTDDDDSDTAVYLQPEITIVKTITDGGVYAAADDIVYYNFEIINTGEVTLNGPFTIVDDKIGTLTDCVNGPLAPGNSVNCQGQYTILAQDVSNGFVTNIAYATTTYGGDPIQSETDSATAFATGSDLAIVKIVDNETPDVDAEVTFTLTATNNGPVEATGVEVQDLLPSGYTYVSHNTATGTYNQGTGLWAIGALDVDDPVTLTITASVNAPTGTPDEYLNEAEISGNEDDYFPDNDTDSAEVTPLVADLELEKVADEMSVRVGQNAIFTITVENLGPDTALNVVVNDLLPDGFEYVSDTPSVGSYDDQTGIWTIGTMNFEAIETLQIVAEVLVSGSLLNEAEASSDTYDPDTDNNEDSVLITRTQSLLITNPMIHSRVKND